MSAAAKKSKSVTVLGLTCAGCFGSLCLHNSTATTDASAASSVFSCAPTTDSDQPPITVAPEEEEGEKQPPPQPLQGRNQGQEQQVPHDRSSCSADFFQVSAHRLVSRSLLTELERVIGGAAPAGEVVIVSTLQHAVAELVSVGERIEAEKDKLLLTFFEYAAAFCTEMEKRSFWADYVDPCSGLLMKSAFTNVVYNEVQVRKVGSREKEKRRREGGAEDIINVNDDRALFE